MLKTLVSVLCLSGSLGIAQGSAIAPIPTGAFSMLKEPKARLGQGCSIGVKLVLDKAEISGPFVLLTSFVNGFCEIYVSPNPRFIAITDSKIDGCGSKIYSGTIKQADSTTDVVITDNRARLCEDMLPALIVLEENVKSVETGLKSQQFFYSVDR